MEPIDVKLPNVAIKNVINTPAFKVFEVEISEDVLIGHQDTVEPLSL